jgi:hypothetical protein
MTKLGRNEPRSPRLVYDGSMRCIVWVSDESGRYQGESFYKALGTADRAKMHTLFERFGDFGQIRNPEHFRLEEDGIYCFKRYQQRMFCFFDGNMVCVTHGVKKKSNRVARGELNRAKRLRALHLETK